MGDESQPRVFNRIAGAMSGLAAILIAALGLKSAVTAWWAPSAEASAPAENMAEEGDANAADAPNANVTANAADDANASASSAETETDADPAPADSPTR